MSSFDAFYSDPHFGHRGALRHCERPFDSIEEQTEELIRRYNVVVRPNDYVLWLGDCFFCSLEDAKRIMARLNGRKGLCMGNHDKSKTWMLAAGFDFAVDQLQLRIGREKVIACHYPYKGESHRNGKVDDRYLDRRPKPNKGQWLLHGHTHSNKKLGQRKQIHLGIDAWDYYPALWSEVERLINE